MLGKREERIKLDLTGRNINPGQLDRSIILGLADKIINPCIDHGTIVLAGSTVVLTGRSLSQGIADRGLNQGLADRSLNQGLARRSVTLGT